jgi:fructan beta-fructosidase
MKSNSMITKAACLMLMASATTSAFAQKMNIEHKGDTTIIKVENPTKYLLLPIQEEKDEAQVLLDTGSKDDTWMDVRLAQNGSDYYVLYIKSTTQKLLYLQDHGFPWSQFQDGGRT